MLGHRGCRLGNTYPEITEMQARAIIEAALNVKAKGVDVHPKIMVPLIGVKPEIQMQADIINETAKKVFAERGETVAYKVGTMIEIPRAALVADQIASQSTRSWASSRRIRSRFSTRKVLASSLRWLPARAVPLTPTSTSASAVSTVVSPRA